MQRPRLIPVLLLKNNGLVKSTSFSDFRYIGDPVNAVKIFNDSGADELFFLDITATKEKRLISLDFVKTVVEEAQMPFAVGGGIRSLDNINALINAGAERVIINTTAGLDPGFVNKAATKFGSSTIVVCIDVKKDFWKKEKVWIKNGTKPLSYNAVEYAKMMQENGAGEIVVQSISQDGRMKGYDIDLIKKVSSAVTIPVVALGGAGSIQDMKELHQNTYVNGLAAGSLFVYQGNEQGVLINYPANSNINLL